MCADAEAENLVFLIGVFHEIQVRRSHAPSSYWSREWDRFEKYLDRLIDEEGIQIAAEELSKKALGTGESVLQQVAQARSIEHRFLDPDEEESAELGIFRNLADCRDVERTGPPREREWVKRAATNARPPLLVLCGDHHVRSLTARLEDKGFEVVVQGRSWGAAMLRFALRP